MDAYVGILRRIIPSALMFGAQTHFILHGLISLAPFIQISELTLRETYQWCALRVELLLSYWTDC